ncbi:bicaudal D-related protein homolog [Eurytemora carolleeae]|uniref:bicaudal D-related protein homolog n=1 Tax=Eurytemora carolleeae TaxID=1294199 RepID=UPI000C76F6DE|nr:bicaudal D-related protein homolog [Eurytemora carolleeae]|eukprot:XP_023343909.1 bicaudal D-related protein homolog [Eurytemora affinis]
MTRNTGGTLVSYLCAQLAVLYTYNWLLIMFYYRMLAGKERDLILAAELGKALLLKNEELSRKNEQMAEEYSFKLEDLEQENYQLRRRLEVAEEEYEIRIQELQTDLTNLRDAIGHHSSSHKFFERDKNQTINDLINIYYRLSMI